MDDLHADWPSTWDALIKTDEGEFKEIMGPPDKKLSDHGDVIHALMIQVMKLNQARQGVWYWVIKHNFSSIHGYENEICDDDM